MESSNTPPPQKIITGYAKTVYVLYLIGLMFGITAVIAVVIAYIKKGESGTPAWLNRHYQFQIRTFWFGLVYFSVGFILMPFFIGWLILGWWMIWLIIRSVKGLNAIDKQVGIEGSFFGLGNELPESAVPQPE